MAGFDASRSQLLKGAANPAAPAGLRQTSTRLAADQQAYDSGRTQLRPWMPGNSMLETAKSWYTGANAQDTKNGWDTTFYKNAFTQYDQWQQKAATEGKGSTFYGWLDPNQNKQATGVATWGADPTDQAAKQSGAMRFGDVFNNGKKVANLYDDYDKATADVMVGEFLFTNDEKKRAWATPTPGPDGRPQMNQAKYAEMVAERREENTNRALFSKSAESYDSNVKARERSLREGKGDEGVIAGGAIGGALLGAGAGAVIGSVVPIVGTAVGAVVGGVVGAVAGGAGGALNQDQLVEMTARAQEKADIANRDLGANWLQKSTMQVGEYSQLGTKMLSPLSNIWQGAQDARLGKVGDMTSEFYAVDAKGDRKVGFAVQGGDIAATLGDGVLQFASPVGRWATMLTMGGTVAGGVSEMTTGAVFNEKRGTYDQLDGWQEWAAATGSTAIDAVQMGAAGGFAKAARASRGLYAGNKAARSPLAAEEVGRFAPDAATGLDKAYTKVLGGKAGRAGQATTRVDANGARFVVGAEGEVLSVRPTLAALAPSESLRWIETGYRARKLAAIDGGEMTRDHMLKAAIDLQQGTRFRNAVLMGYTEGGEEFAQAILDPLRTGDKVEWGTAFESFLYGAAGGAGMGLGPNNKGASSKQQVEAQAYVQHTMRTGAELSPEEWKDYTKGWKPKDFEKVARTNATENKNTQAVMSTLADNQRQDQARHSAIGFAWGEQTRSARSEELQRKALEEGNGSLVLKGQTSEFLTTSTGTVEKSKFAANAGVMSARETIHQLDLIADGHQAQLDRVNEELAALPVTGDEHTQQLRTEMTQRKADLDAQVRVSRPVADFMLGMYRDFVNERNPALLERHVELMNQTLKEAYSGTWRPGGLPSDPDLGKRVQRAVELKLGRHPFIDRGSFAVALPQISVELTKLNAHSELYLQQGMLKAMNADHDGDTVVPLHSVYEDDASLARLRRGDQYMQVTEDDDKRPTVKVVISNPDSEWAFMDSFAEAMRDPQSWSADTLTKRLNSLVTDIKTEFASTSGGPLDATSFDKLLATFKESVLAGREDARMNLVTDMVNLDYEGMRNHQNADGVPNVQWLWSRINEAWDITQKDLAHVRASESTQPTISPQREAQETTIRSTIARANAATASATLGLLASDPVRGAQHLHYNTLYRSLTEFDPNATMTTQQQIDLTTLFMRLGTGQTQRDIDLLTGRNAIEERVYHWLGMMANSVTDTSRTVPEVMLLLSNMSVPAIEMVLPNEYQVVKGEITMLQLLLGRSLDIERAKHRAAEPDSDIVKKINKLDRLTKRDPDRSKHSTTASLAMIEVMGNRPLYELVGSASSYIGPQITLNQLVQQERGLHPRVRSDEIHRLVRSPAYIKDDKRTFGDPPWPADVLSDTDPPINAFAMLVDAVKTAGDTYLPALRARDATVQKNFVNGLAGLHQELNAHRARHSERLTGEGKTELVDVLHDVLATDVALAADIAKLIPEAAALGVFQIQDGNWVSQAKWLDEVLTNEDYEKAVATYYLQIKLAEFNQLSGTVDASVLARREAELGKGTVLEVDDVRGKIDPTTLKSRFLQVFTHLASQSDQIEVSRFLTAMTNAPSVDAMFKTINSEPMWRNNQAELLPWHDDVSDFEVDPADSWNTDMAGALQRESIRGWGQRMQIRGSIAAEAAVNFEANKSTLHGMEQWIKTRNTTTPVDLHDGAQNVGLLNRWIENRKLFPDYQGQAARSQLVELQQMGLAAVQNKGVADPKAAPYGEPLITLDSFGWSDGLRQEIASLTSEDVEDVMTNLTLLTDGPVRMMMADGSMLTFDITTDEKALAMLMDPRTQGLALATLGATVRDVNDANVVQTYIDTDARSASDSQPVISTLLKEQTFRHLFQNRPDFGERLQQAHRYIGNIEGYVRKQAVGSDSQAELDRAFMPIQQMVHDVMTAYLHSTDEVADDKSTRDRLFVDIADSIKAVASVHPDARASLRERLAAEMERRYLGDTTLQSRLLQNGTARKAFVDLKLAEQQVGIYKDALADFDARQAAATTQDAKDAIELEREQFIRDAAAAQGQLPAMPHQTYLNAASALKKFEMSGDPVTDTVRKAEIIAFLGAQDRIHKLERKTVYKIDGVEVNGQSLYHSFMREFDENPVAQTYAPQEWAVLGSWAAELYLDDITSRSSSSVPATGALLGDDGAAVQRYFDLSFSYLTDTLFDPKVLEAADKLSQRYTHYERRDSTDVANELLSANGLLSDKKIGTWSEVIVNESMKARLVLKNSTVGAAVAQEGNDPKVMADYVGAGKVTWQRPEPGHFSSAQQVGTKEELFSQTLKDPMALIKLQNHFVRRVTIQNTDPANPLDPGQAEALASVSSVNHTSAETEAAGQITPGDEALRVLDLAKLENHIEWLKSNHQLGDYTVTIEYVDVNKKPHERQWANNIFFDGVGREAVGGSGMGAIASLFFGLNALSKIGQQNPLDAATKQGMSFKAHKRSSLLEVELLERDGAPLSEILGAKALHMLGKTYPMGELQQADLPSLYKLMKMRHVVVGTNANGVKEVWWPEQLIQLEESGAAVPLQNPKLVQLSDRVAQTLWGRSGAIGVTGTRGSLTRPTFNIADLDIFPALDLERLNELGLDRLGEEAELGNTRLAQVNIPPREVVTYNRGDTYVSLYKKRLKEWRGELRQVNTLRSERRKEGKGKLDIERITQVNSQLIIDMLDVERQAVGAKKLGMTAGVADLGAMEMDRAIGAQISNLMETENNMVWVHKHGAGGDMTEGWVGRADLDNNFAGMNGMGPVFGDVVVLDLSDIQAATDINNYQDASNEAARVLEEYAKRGVTVALQASRGQFDLRADVVERLSNGSVGYRPMAESGNFFVPITEDATFNAAQRALASTQTETEQSTTKNMALRFVADGLSSNLTEGTEWIDVQHDRAYNVVSHTILPYRMTSTGGVDQRIPFAFNIPQRGTGQADQLGAVNSKLLGLLTDPTGEGRKYLKKLFGPENTDYPQYIEHPNGTVEHGVLPIDDALDRLEQTLQANKWVLDSGETFFPGTIVPLVGGDGSIHLSRVGFNQPNHFQMDEQRKIRYGDMPRKFTASTNVMDPNQTLPPPTVVDEIRADNLGLSVVGTYRPNPLAKSVSEGLGLKTGQSPMPPGLSFPGPIAAPNTPGMRVTRAAGSTSVVGKEAGDGTINNFRDAFMAMGVNFEDDMIDFMFGENATRTVEERNQLWDLAQRALKMWAADAHPYTATQLSRMLDNRSALVTMEARFNAIGKTIAPDTWQGISLGWSKGTAQPPLNRLGTVLLTALAAPGVRLEHVISTSGVTTVSDHNSDLLVRRMPAIFTDALNDLAYPDLRTMLINRLNRNMPVDPATGKMLMWFDNQLKFHMTMTQDTKGGPREEEIVGFLQVHVPVPADENSIRQSYAGISSGGQESKHIADTIAGATGGRLAPKARKPSRVNIPDSLDELYGENAIERFKNPEDGAAAFAHMLTRIRTDAPRYNPWGRVTPMEDAHLDKIQAKVRQHTYRGERSKETGWTPDQVTAGDRLAMNFLAKLNITDPKAKHEVEYLVRQLFGIPGPALEQEDYQEHLTFKFFQAGIEYMTRNIEKGMHPLEGGKVPLEHQAFWKMVFDAQRGLPKADQWLPLKSGNKVKEYAQADNWGDWVTSLHGQMRASHKAFDSRFRPDLDGFFRTYQGTHPDYMELAISTDEQIAAKLQHPEINRQFMSVDPGYDAVLRDPIVLASRYMNYDALVGHGTVFTLSEAEETSESVITQRLDAMTAWQKGEGLPKQKDLSVREYARQGAAYQESSRNTNALMRTLVNISVITRLFNPALYVSAMFEVPFRSALEGVTNVLTGQLTGTRGKVVSGVAAGLEQGLGKLGAKGVTLQPRYSVDDINRLNSLNSSMGESNRFLGLIYGELAYQTVIAGGHGRAGRALEYSAGAVARLTADPRWPMKQTSLAKRYNDAVWEHLSLTNSIITIEQYAFQMQQNPEWLKDEFPEAHQMGLNAVKQARGAKSTMLGNLIMNPIDKMAKSENLLVNGAGHLLKIPFLFTRFNANMLVTMTGLSGFDQAMAMIFDGRQRPQVIKRLMNRAKLGESDVNTPEYWDNTDVLESIDLSRAFVRGAVTQTGLMAAGLLASGLSLGGEDDEERRRKRMATYLNTPYYHDPNKAANDFRWTDAIFLDNVPVLGNIYTNGKKGPGLLTNETGHAAVVPHWIFRQFLSPVLGMMRFFETGNSMEIAYGFDDAVSVMPNSVTRLWDDANMTHQLLMQTAADDGGIPEKENQVRQLLMNVAFVYEKALVENAFINGLYQASDEYDRNPWAIAQTDETGDIVREQGTGLPVPTKALQAYQTGEGAETSNRVAYMTRRGMDALVHQYAEGNATAAVMLSIIPWAQGHDTSYLRGNMVTKRERVKTSPSSKEQVEALLYSTYLGRGGQDFVSKEEIIGAIKQREQAAGRYWKQGEVEAEADKVYATMKDKPLSVFDKGGKEAMTTDGKAAVFRSLRDGVIDLDNPAISGFNISQAERDAIAEELTAELVQEGVDLGLSDQSAMFRMRRIWYGDGTKPSAPGLREILYDKRIPDKPYAEYDRLNVTYVLGPDGKPWATPFQKANVAQVLGIPLPHTMAPVAPGTTLDQRGNVVDLIRGINTGQAALVPRPVATEVEANDDAVKKAEAKKYTPGGTGYKKFPWRNFGRRGYGRGGGGGGYGGGGGAPFFQRMQALPQGTSARIDDVQAINTSNPIIRRADVRRERITSERGRLKQWQ